MQRPPAGFHFRRIQFTFGVAFLVEERDDEVDVFFHGGKRPRQPPAVFLGRFHSPAEDTAVAPPRHEGGKQFRAGRIPFDQDEKLSSNDLQNGLKPVQPSEYRSLVVFCSVYGHAKEKITEQQPQNRGQNNDFH